MSHEIHKPERATYYVARAADGSILHEGVTLPGQVTTSGQAVFETATEETEHLAHLAPVAARLAPLPEAGERLEAGAVYRDGDAVVVVRQSHTRTHHAPSEVPALFLFVNDTPDWLAGEQVQVGTRRRYEGTWWQALQAHVTQEDWAPPIVPALWVAVAEEPPAGATWVDTGATVSGQAGQLYYLSATVASLGLSSGQAIKLGTAETTFVALWPGTNNLIQINPYVTVSVGAKVWKWS
jgi:hypothetical protein